MNQYSDLSCQNGYGQMGLSTKAVEKRLIFTVAGRRIFKTKQYTTKLF